MTTDVKVADLKVGDGAPDFHLPTDRDGDLRLSDFAGCILVLYFYPKDDTSGCTSEAIAFSKAASEFDALSAVVVGVSKDSVKKHAKFRQKHDLTVKLGADESGETVERYGVWVEKSMYGRKYMGIERATFLIDAEGLIRKIWRKVSVTGHVEDVLAAVRSLGGQ
jgi:peroxiredoxin Q/BCP